MNDNEIWSVNRIKYEKCFSWKSCAKYGGETSPRPFLKKLKLSISLDQQSKVSYSLFLKPSRELPKDTEANFP